MWTTQQAFVNCAAGAPRKKRASRRALTKAQHSLLVGAVDYAHPVVNVVWHVHDACDVNAPSVALRRLEIRTMHCYLDEAGLALSTVLEPDCQHTHTQTQTQTQTLTHTADCRSEA